MDKEVSELQFLQDEFNKLKELILKEDFKEIEQCTNELSAQITQLKSINNNELKKKLINQAKDIREEINKLKEKKLKEINQAREKKNYNNSYNKTNINSYYLDKQE